MPNLKLLTATLFLILIIQSVGYANNSDLEDHQSFRFGLALNANRSGDFTHLDFVGPSIFRFQVSGIKLQTAAYTLMGFHNTYNIDQDAMRSKASQSFYGSLGLENRTQAIFNSTQVYTKLGINYFDLDPNIYRQDGAYGVHIDLGADFVFSPNRKDIVSGFQASSSFFMQVTGIFALPRATRLSPAPNLLNGLAIGVGIRNHY